MLVLPKRNRPRSAGSQFAIALTAMMAPLPLMSQPGGYSVQKLTIDAIPIVRLIDAKNGVEASVAPSLGNDAYEMKVHGTPVLWSPYTTPGQFKAKPTLLGVPLLAPWANRLDEDAFYANGKRYAFDDGLGNIRRDQFRQPIHGLVLNADEVGSHRQRRRRTLRMGEQPARFLAEPRVDGAISVCPYHRDDVPAV